MIQDSPVRSTSKINSVDEKQSDEGVQLVQAWHVDRRAFAVFRSVEILEDEPNRIMSKHTGQPQGLESFTGEEAPSEEVIELGFNPEQFSAMPILRTLYIMFLTVAVVVVLTFWWIKVERQSAIDELSLTSEPRELRQTEAEADRKLTQYGEIDEENGVYRVPIDRAMELMAEEEWKARESVISPDTTRAVEE